jgi:hypothetical protein
MVIVEAPIPDVNMTIKERVCRGKNAVVVSSLPS